MIVELLLTIFCFSSLSNTSLVVRMLIFHCFYWIFYYSYVFQLQNPPKRKLFEFSLHEHNYPETPSKESISENPLSIEKASMIIIYVKLTYCLGIYGFSNKFRRGKERQKRYLLAAKEFFFYLLRSDGPRFWATAVKRKSTDGKDKEWHYFVELMN